MSAAAILAAFERLGRELARAKASTTACVVGAWLARERGSDRRCRPLLGRESCSAQQARRFSLMSRRYVRQPVLQDSIDMVASSGRLQVVFALLPVAGAELVGLQRVEHAQHLVALRPT